MNPLTNVRNVQKLNERELELGIIGKKSWHDEYKDSAWIFIGGLPYDLSEGDVLCVFSQYGEIVNLNMVRDHKTGKSKGFGFLCYEDQRSTVLAVDNLNGIKILSRTIRVDHVKDYKVPKEFGNEDDLTKKIRSEGCAPTLEPSSDEEEGEQEEGKKRKEKDSPKPKTKVKKEKKKKKKKKKERSSSESSEADDEKKPDVKTMDIKTEREDRGYDRALAVSNGTRPINVKLEPEETDRREKNRGRRRSDSSDDERRERDSKKVKQEQRGSFSSRDRFDDVKDRRRHEDRDREKGREDRRDVDRRERDRVRDRDRSRERRRSRDRSREPDKRGDRDFRNDERYRGRDYR